MAIKSYLSNIPNITAFQGYQGNPAYNLASYLGYADTNQEYQDEPNQFQPSDYINAYNFTEPSVSKVTPTSTSTHTGNVGQLLESTPTNTSITPTNTGGVGRLLFNQRMSEMPSSIVNKQVNLNQNPNTKTKQIKSAWSQASLGEKTNAVLGTVGTLLSAYNGYKANQLAKQQFDHAKEVAERNWQAQRKQTNSQLEDRQRRRVEEAAANGRSTTSVTDYMAKYGV